MVDGFLFLRDKTNYNPHEQLMIKRISAHVPDKELRQEIFNTLHVLKRELNLRITDVTIDKSCRAPQDL